ncbi:MAG: formate dehydrogenase accessory sulfurtransferase FdhD [Syntrophaceae bacterium]|nr:formate dehydrogenase accessory sulfurtransferase FdhD [Syntrophaceae bacterium]
MKRRRGTEGIERLRLRRFGGARFSTAAMDVVREVLLEVFADGRRVVTIACAGIHLRELAAGFLKQEGLIEEAADIRGMTVSRGRVEIRTRRGRGRGPAAEAGKTIASSGARGSRLLTAQAKGASGAPAGPTLDARAVLGLMDALLAATEIHERTRGTHCSAIAGPQGILAAREDIGRHNTIDMLCGWALLGGVDLADKVLLTTGRVSSEIVSKAWRMGIRAVVSHSAATSRAVELAKSLGITVVGYVRGGTFVVYAGARHVLPAGVPAAKGTRRKAKG